MPTRSEFKDTFENVIPADILRQRRDDVAGAISTVLSDFKGAICSDEDGAQTAIEKTVEGIARLNPDLLPIPRNEIITVASQMPDVAIQFGKERGLDLGRGVVKLFRRSDESL